MITVIGSVNMDVIARVSHLPQPGQTVLVRSLERMHGGKGANQAVAAARAGSSVALVGKVGSDVYGPQLVDNLRRSGIKTDWLGAAQDLPSGLAMITVDDSGENFIVVVAGANAALQPDDVQAALPAIEMSSVVVAQLEIPPATVLAAAEATRQAGRTFILNPAPAQPLDPELLRLVDVLIPNESEVATLSGMGSPIDPSTSAQFLLDTGVTAVVVTRGHNGALVVTRSGRDEIAGLQTGAVDTTGAGDTFVGNFAHGLDAGMSLLEATSFANAAASLSVGEVGAQTAMPVAAETLRWLDESAP